MFLVQDAIEYTLDYFWKKGNSNAVKEPTEDMLRNYGRMFCKTLNESFGQQQGVFSAKIMRNDMPMIVAHVTLNRGDQNEAAIIDSASTELAEAIKHVDQILLEEYPSGVYTRRNLRVYNGSEIYLIKRNQRRFWTISAAFRDADEIYADIMRSWRG